MLPKRFEVDQQCRKCGQNRRSCRYCSRCQQHCRCEDDPPLIQRIELSGSGCEFLVREGERVNAFDLFVRDREGRDIVQFKGVWLFQLEDLAKEVLLKELDSFSTLEVLEEALKSLEPDELARPFRWLSEDRLKMLHTIILEALDEGVG